jgi:ribonucleoside-diphosphate reductase beta chain
MPDDAIPRDELPIRFDLLTANPVYKPFRYPWAYEAWLQQQRIHWLPEEVPLADDVKDWQKNLTPSEKNLLTQIFRFFTQADVEVNNCYMKQYSQVFKPTEVLMMMSAFSNTETIHIAAYSHLLDTIGMPEIEYTAFLKYKEMKDKYDYMQTSRSRTRPRSPRRWPPSAPSRKAAAVRVLRDPDELPALQQDEGHGAGRVVVVRDETLHCLSVIRLFRTFVQENPRSGRRSFGATSTSSAPPSWNTRTPSSTSPSSWAASRGLDGAGGEAVHPLHRRPPPAAARLEPLYHIEKNPLPWLDEMLGAVEHTNFFENRATEYSRASTAGSWEDAFADSTFTTAQPEGEVLSGASLSRRVGEGAALPGTPATLSAAPPPPSPPPAPAGARRPYPRSGPSGVRRACGSRRPPAPSRCRPRRPAAARRHGDR